MKKLALPLFLLSILSLSLGSFTVVGKQKNFKGTSFDAVLITEFSPLMDTPFPSEMKDLPGRSVDTSLFKVKTYLAKPEGDSLYRLMTDKNSYNLNASICWNPHLGIYFLKSGKIVNYVQVCLDCNRLMSMLRIKESEPVKNGKINLPAGLAPAFRKYINAILIKYKFAHTIKANDPFEK